MKYQGAKASHTLASSRDTTLHKVGDKQLTEMERNMKTIQSLGDILADLQQSTALLVSSLGQKEITNKNMKSYTAAMEYIREKYLNIILKFINDAKK